MSDSAWRVPLSDIEVDDELMAAAAETLRSGWWSMGPRVAEFEEAFAAYVGTRHAFAVSSGTSALHLALAACGCGPGDEVIVPSLTFVAAANTIRHAGAEPVFCDVNGADDLNLDVASVEAAIGPRTKAIAVLHYGGHPCDMEGVLALAAEHDLVVVEDAAHALGASVGGRMCGAVGLAGCFSFFSNKNLPIGEGGMVVTDDGGVADRIRLLRSHGMTTLTWDRHRGHAHSYEVVTSGFNYRLDEVRAALGLVQLRRLDGGNAARGLLVARYRERFEDVPGLTMPFAGADDDSAHHLAAVVLPEDTDRNELRSALQADGIQTSVHYPPVHQFSAFAAVRRATPLDVTEEVAPRLLTLPLYPSLGEERVDLVADALAARLAVTVR
jgi:dTDP-4-amino-4,6-dideoxygalactose transaminase